MPRPLLRPLAAALVALLALAPLPGCDSGLPDDDTLVNGITYGEIRAGHIPTYPEIGAAAEAVLAADPALVDDPLALARALFDAVQAAAGAAPKAELPDLTFEEWVVVLDQPAQAVLAYDAAAEAIAASEAAYPCGARLDPRSNDDKTDAVRHAYWTAMMAWRVARVYGAGAGSAFALRLSTAHESDTDGIAGARQRRTMDLSNNLAGLEVFSANPEAAPAELFARITALPFEFVEPGEEIRVIAGRLVYFKDPSPYDVTLTGSFTNPDSGGPWSATLTLNQCDATVRGGLEIRRDGGLQTRAVVGTERDGTLALQISDPLGSAAGNPCRGMAAELGGSPASLSGDWTASNCRLGGVLSVRR